MREFSSKPPQAEADDHPLEGVSFTLDGETFTCHPDRGASGLRMAELARQSRRGDVEAGLAASAEGFRLALGGDEYARFVDYAEEHDTADETLLAIGEYLDEEARKRMEKATGRPTRKRQRSSRGPQKKDDRMSRVISLQTGDVQVISDEKTG
jgi:hypothetical protein